ncbi:Lysine histidine transporter-like 8-like protein [Drosera capensis]
MEFRHLSLSNSMRVQPIEEATPPRETLNMESVMEGVIVKESNPQEAWIPITESRNGNLFTCIFHLLVSGIGIQALLLPVAFAQLGWSKTWEIAMFIFCYVSIGRDMHHLYYNNRLNHQEVFANRFVMMAPGAILMTELHLIFVCVTIMIARLPNFNSVAWVSLIGAVTAIVYTSMIWTVPLTKDRPVHTSYTKPEEMESDAGRAMSIVGALGIIAVAFRGHNLVIEIEGTLPSSSTHPPSKTMWRARTTSYIVVALCVFSIAIGGFWAYGTQIPTRGMLEAPAADFHGPELQAHAMHHIHHDHNQQPMVLLNIRNASLRQPGATSHDHQESPMPLVAKDFAETLLRMHHFLYIGSISFLAGAKCPARRHDNATGLCLSLFHVDHDE